MNILFPCFPLDKKKVDSSFAEEYQCALDAGFDVSLVDVDDNDKVKSIKPKPEGVCLYRGWMLSYEAYKALDRKVTLFTSPKAYRESHHLNQWYPTLKGHTPPSKIIKMVDALDDEILGDIHATFGSTGMVIKGLVKSLKHRWDDAMFVPPGASMEVLRARVKENIRDADGSAYLVFRKYMEIETQGAVKMMKTDPPTFLVKREYRLFFLNGEHMISGEYWDGLDVNAVELPIDEITLVVRELTSSFISVDLAKLADGGWTIIEVGDGCVSGLQEISPVAFYHALAEGTGIESPTENYIKVRIFQRLRIARLLHEEHRRGGSIGYSDSTLDKVMANIRGLFQLDRSLAEIQRGRD